MFYLFYQKSSELIRTAIWPSICIWDRQSNSRKSICRLWWKRGNTSRRAVDVDAVYRCTRNKVSLWILGCWCTFWVSLFLRLRVGPRRSICINLVVARRLGRWNSGNIGHSTYKFISTASKTRNSRLVLVPQYLTWTRKELRRINMKISHIWVTIQLNVDRTSEDELSFIRTLLRPQN